MNDDDAFLIVGSPSSYGYHSGYSAGAASRLYTASESTSTSPAFRPVTGKGNASRPSRSVVRASSGSAFRFTSKRHPASTPLRLLEITDHRFATRHTASIFKCGTAPSPLPVPAIFFNVKDLCTLSPSCAQLLFTTIRVLICAIVVRATRFDQQSVRSAVFMA